METPAHTISETLPVPAADPPWECVATIGTLVFSRPYSGAVPAQTAARAVAWEVLLEHGLFPRPRQPREVGDTHSSACTPAVTVHVRKGADGPSSRHVVRCSVSFDWRA